MKFQIKSLAAAAALTALAGASFAQATIKDDGQWRYSVGASLSNASGNTESRNLALNADGVRATKDNKISLYGTILNGASGGATTANQMRLGGRYDQNFSAKLFGFAGGEFEKDKIGNLSPRITLSGGLGYHVLADSRNTFDVFGGVAHTNEKYITPVRDGNTLWRQRNINGLVLGEESTHKLSDTTSFKQRFVIYPHSSQYRSQFDAGLGVAMSKAMNLNVGLSLRTNSDPAPGLKKTDTLLTSGVSVKFD